MASPSTSPIRSFIVICLFAALPLCCHSMCHPGDRAALVDIDKNFNNAFSNELWNLTVDCCEWQGVQCDNTSKRVIELSLHGMSLKSLFYEFTGPMPDAIGRLTDLRRLYVRTISHMSGGIPPSMAGLIHLEVLMISGTNISGPIPDWVGRFTNLTSLDLSFSSFTGAIPSSLGYLPKIAEINLDTNRLSGPIPDSFGRFPGTVPTLNLNTNLLTSVPPSMGDRDFKDISVAHNQLEGDVSFLFKNRSGSLKFINLSWNRLEFDLSRFVFPLKLEFVSLAFNKIYGSIPRAIEDVPALTQFDVSSNMLCGPIPQGGRMKRIKKSSFVANKCLCGSPISKRC